MDKRYQVFVSSTYTDLLAERSEVMQALLELKCMPAGMELFPAANDTQWNWIKKVIDESDYYIVLGAGRYGTVSKETGQSFTEMEYRYAIETGKPVIGFLHEDISKLQAKFVEQTASGRRKLEAFRQLVGTRLCKFYNSSADLGAKVSRSITQLREQHPAVGWIRADLVPSAVRVDEILKLKEENERLTEHIYRLGLQEPDTLALLASGGDLFDIQYFFSRMEENSETGTFRRADIHDGVLSMSWDDIFAIIGPSLIEPNPDWSIPKVMLPVIEQRVLPKLRRQWPENRFQRFLISSTDADAILLQLRALKLISFDEPKGWCLTPYGDNYMARLLAVPKGERKR